MKKNWIFLRDLGRDSRHWGTFIKTFENEFPHDSIHLIDIPGSGEYSDEICPTSIPEIVDIIASRWQDNNPDEISNIIALSFGGMIAIEWMSRYPKMIDSAVLMNISARDSSPFYKRLRYQKYRQLLSMMFSSNRKREYGVIDLTSNLYVSRKSLVELWSSYCLTNATSQLNVFRQLWAAMFYKLPAQKPEQKIMLLNSLEDQIVAPDCSKAIAKQWKLPLYRHPTAGHDLTLDCPQWVISQIKQI
ncbi:MAG: alpha/beta hydrolase [Gammaproteobacteria bacterium]|nr:alpha/beta hydrolase [Gammaproteobacteria bacterium]